MSAPAGAATLRVATRGSVLALAQTALVIEALRSVGGVEAEAVVVRTRGDRDQSTPAAAMDGQGWFTADLESALRDGRADVAVHSAKDLPTEPRAGLEIAAHLARADPRDALVTRDGSALASLRSGAVVGTSSPRRQAFLLAIRPDLRCLPVRGNVDTRLRKLDAGEVDALLVAAAGLDRLGLGGRAAERFDPLVMPPAAAQGAIALQTAGGGPARAVCGNLDHPGTSRAVAAERSLLAALGGGCLVPVGAWARMEGSILVLSAGRVEDGRLRAVTREGAPADPEALGREVAAALDGAGA